ncbi:MAG: hypothetical protein H7X77_00180, partial [Anaerolineae bacterium]|nr:hypothetical protein [Anaerolineae bacterium]
GGILNQGTMTLTNSTITANNASSGGGGIYNDGSSQMTVTLSTISENTAASGGGIGSWGTLTVQNSSITNNISSFDSGGLYNGGPLTLIDMTISDNTAVVAGGIRINSGAVVIINSTISDNTAQAHAGISKVGADPALIINTVLSGNSATEEGGALTLKGGGTVTIINSTIVNNSADEGGAVLTSEANTLITNSILWGNSSEIQTSSPITVTYSTVQGGYTGTGNLSSDPLFVDTVNGDYHLQDTSPAINMGSNAALPADTYDLDGDNDLVETIPYDYGNNARIQSTTVDMGMYESSANQSPVVSDIPDQTIEVGTTFTTFDLDNYVSDPNPGDTVIWSAAGNTDLVVSIDASNVVTITPPVDWEGGETLTFTATDSGNLTDSDTATFTVTPVNTLVVNGGFETAGATDPEASGWTTSKTLSSDRRVCNTETKTYTPYGDCAFRFKAKAVQPTRKLKQDLALESLAAGDMLSLSYNASGKKLTGKVQVIVQVYYNGVDDAVKIKSNLSAGTFDWQTVTPPDTLVLTEIPVKVKVIVKASQSTGQAYLDEIIVSKIAGAPVSMLIPLVQP